MRASLRQSRLSSSHILMARLKSMETLLSSARIIRQCIIICSRVMRLDAGECVSIILTPHQTSLGKLAHAYSLKRRKDAAHRHRYNITAAVKDQQGAGYAAPLAGLDRACQHSQVAGNSRGQRYRAAGWG